MNFEFEQTSSIIAFFLTVFRLSTPLCFASFGGYCSERSGTINIALEGMMLVAAFAAAATSSLTGNPWFSLVSSLLASLLLATLHGFLCITLKADPIISGMTVNFSALGITPVLSKVFFDMSSSTPVLEQSQRLPLLFGLSPLFLLVLPFAILLWFVHGHTSLGQYFRFAGEKPAALATQGVSVAKIQWIGVLLSGVFCAFAGAYLSIDHGSGFSRNMTAGRGFIALSALILGRWTPHGAFLACLLFGSVEASQILLQGTTLPSGMVVPVQWIQMLPYIATLMILAFFSKRAWT